MAFGSLLTGIIAPLIVHSIINGKRMTQNNGEMPIGASPPYFNVNIHNQDSNYNQDKTDVKDNGNLNHQQGNSHLTAHGNLQTSQNHLGFHQRSPVYPYPIQRQGFPQGYQQSPMSYPYYSPYAYPGYPTKPSLRFPVVNGLPIWLQPSSSSLRLPSLVPVGPEISPDTSRKIKQELERTSNVIQRLLESASLKKEEKKKAQELPPAVSFNETEEVLDGLLELAKDPLYDPSQDSNSTENALIPLSSLRSSREKRDDSEGNY